MDKKVCPDCEKYMVHKGFISTGEPVMGKPAKGVNLYQCPECKRIEVW